MRSKVTLASLAILLGAPTVRAYPHNPRDRDRPTVGAQGFGPGGAVMDGTHARNKWREKIVNEFLKKRGTPQTITSTVSSLRPFETWNITRSFYESTLGMVARGMWAHVPGGSKSYYSGLHPRSVEYWFDNKTTRLQIAHCFLDFYTSKVIPGRIFIRSRHCAEHPFAIATAGYKGYHFAGVVQVDRGRITKFKDLTNDLVKLGMIDHDTQFVTYLTDASLFEDPARQGGGGGGGGDMDDMGPNP